nr:PREDICTED: uncharacterized protein LOC107397938 [Tribolium castaneum]|eukprot:XP_015835534.1 PREDICTED: uncharacterized protein LOC107397938 [Tribolium castaneum]
MSHVPEAIRNEARSVVSGLLPKKSSARCEHHLDFKNWQKKQNVGSVNEEVILAYLNQLSMKYSPNSLWSKWSMLKSCLEIKENIGTDRFYKVIAFLKRKNDRYTPKKAKILTKEQVETFLLEAPDDQWLLFKVVTIFGIFGACRCDELLSLTPNDVEDRGKYIIVTLRNTKNFTTRRFTITDEECRFQPCVLYRKYASLRPTQAESLRLFLTYRGGKCISLNAGQHTIGGIPKKIASYLKLSEPELYTGHSFRRSAATMVVDSGGDILALKRAGGWKSSAVAEGYVEDSIKQKLERAKKLFLVPEPTSASSSSKHASTVSEETSEKFNVSGNQNCNITINVYSREINPVNNE